MADKPWQTGAAEYGTASAEAALAAATKAKEEKDEQAAADVVKPVEPPKPADGSAGNPAPPPGTVSAPAPSLPGALSAPAPTPGTLVKDDARQKELDYQVKKHLIDRLFEMEKAQRDDARWQAQQAERVATMRANQRRPWKFTATMNGVTGHSNFKVQWFNADGSRSNGRDDTISTATPGAKTGFDADKFIGAISGIVNGKKGKPSDKVPSGPKGPLLPADGDWLPKDLTPDKGAFSPEDFFGANEEGHSGRFGGGYRDPAYRERYIALLMGGRKAGSAGYEKALKSAELQWQKAETDFDTRFRMHGENLLRKQQTKKAEEKGKKAAIAAGTTEATASAVIQAATEAADKAAASAVARPFEVRAYGRKDRK